MFEPNPFAFTPRVDARVTLIGLSIALPATMASADLVDRWTVGEGDSTATLQFDFMNANTYVFDIAFDGVLTGRGVFDLLAADDTGRFGFAFEVISYSFGDFLVGVGIEDDYHYGAGSPPDYADSWHYWTAEGPDAWSASMIGFSDRELSDGSRDAWVFGSFDSPAAIPAPGSLAMLAAGLLGSRRRRR